MPRDHTRSTVGAGTLAVFLDYSVLDQLHRIDRGAYRGPHDAELRRLRAGAVNRRINIWMSEITSVEMLRGLENVSGDGLERSHATEKDSEKHAIAASMFVRWLGYPCSKLDDTYSRLDVSFRLAGPDWGAANALEKRLLRFRGVSPGDARQLVSCAFPFDGAAVQHRPTLHWAVAEDQSLIAAVKSTLSAGALPELAHLRIGTARDIVSTNPEVFGHRCRNLQDGDRRAAR